MIHISYYQSLTHKILIPPKQEGFPEAALCYMSWNTYNTICGETQFEKTLRKYNEFMGESQYEMLREWKDVS